MYFSQKQRFYQLDLVRYCSYKCSYSLYFRKIIHLTKTTAAQNEDALSFHNVRGLYIPAVVFVTNTAPRHISYILQNIKHKVEKWLVREWVKRVLHFSQKQLSRIMKSRSVITNCAGYIFWQLFLRRV